MHKRIIYLVLIFCFIGFQSGYSQQKNIHNRSKQLIDRYNKVRRSKSLPIIQHDTILDNVAYEILHNIRKYKKSTTEFNEDSIRFTFYNSGVVDYIFEIKVIPENDGAGNKFKAFFLADRSRNIKMGYSKYGAKNLLIKTNSYVKFEHAECFMPALHIDWLHNKSKTMQVSAKNDSIKYYLKIVTPGKYYYHYSNQISSNNDSINDIKRYKARVVTTNNKGMQNNFFDLVITSKNPELYLIITNEKKEKVAILK